jgi:hypothetical protein
MSNDQITSASCGPGQLLVGDRALVAVAEALDVEAPDTPRLLT